jgi:hypothetical protein
MDLVLDAFARAVYLSWQYGNFEDLLSPAIQL